MTASAEGSSASSAIMRSWYFAYQVAAETRASRSRSPRSSIAKTRAGSALMEGIVEGASEPSPAPRLSGVCSQALSVIEMASGCRNSRQ